jgi:hypothetical protein
MIAQLAYIVNEVADHPTIMSDMARMTAKYRDALMAEGFTREEAVDIASKFKLSGS